MPCPFTGPKMFWAGPSILSQTKNLFTYCGSHKHFAFTKIGFSAGTKVFEEAQNAVKKFGPAQYILGPVKGQGIRQKYF